MPKTDEEFEEHLEKLAKYTAEDMSDIPTTDQILNGVARPEPGVSLDIEYAVANACVLRIKEQIKQYNGVNVVVRDMITNYSAWLELMRPEIAVFSSRLLLAGLEPEDSAKVENNDAFKAAIKKVMFAMLS